MSNFIKHLVIFIALLAAPKFAHAARIGAEPLLIQMDQGYGVIAAVITKTTAVPFKDGAKYPTYYDVQFKVHEIYAQPITGDRFAVKKDNVFDLRIPVGYACLVEDRWLGPSNDADREDGPLAVGKKYILTLQYDPKEEVYQHAHGAGAARMVKEFTREEKTLIQSARELAATPLPDRLKKSRALVADSAADTNLRLEALAVLRWRIWHDRADVDERKDTARVLLSIWNDKNNEESDYFIDCLDFALRITEPSFEKSTEREDVWLARIFAPINADQPKAREEIGRRRGDLAFFKLTGFGEAHPKKIGDRLVKELANSDWPLELTWRVAGALQTIYEQSPEANETWERALQDYYPPAIDAADEWLLRLLVSNLEIRKHPHDSAEKRNFKPGPRTVKAFEQALARMRSEEDPEKRKENSAAIYHLEKLLKSLKE
jgi:hypothetical protein